MLKKLALPFLILAILLTACSPAARSEPLIYTDEALVQPPSERAVEEAGATYAYEQEAAAVTSGEASDSSAADRLVIKNASLSIAVQNPVENLNNIIRLADEMGGFVVSSNLYNTTLANGAEVPQANITIRVPANRLDEALQRIKTGAGRVLSENISGQDVTREYTDLQSRLRNLEEAEAQLQTIMDEARRTEDVINVFNQLTYYREQIEIVKGQIQYYEQAAAFSAISVEIIADAAVQPITIAGWQPEGVAREALQALVNTLQDIATALIWLGLYVLPVVLLALIPFRLLWIGIKRWRASNRKNVPETPATD